MAFKSLKPLLEKLQAEKGYCSLFPRHYATITARRTCCSTDVETEEQQPYILEMHPGTGQMTFRLLEGATGWEAWSVDDLVSRSCRDWWAACCGTPGRWDRLMVNGAEILEVLKECGYV